MKPFRERNPALIGLVSLAVIAACILGAFRADRLPLIGGGDTYYANFAESGGLKAGNEVRMAGVTIGKVEDISLQGDHVRVKFLVDKPADLGRDTGAAIRVRTLLGAMYLAVDTRGGGELGSGTTIPTKRTEAPYDAVEAFSGLARTTSRINTKQLAQALDTVSEVADGTPKDFRAALDGVSRLSRNIAARDAQINTLLKNVDKVSGTLSSHNKQLAKLFKDADVLFRAVAARRATIHKLLVNTQRISTQLEKLIKDTKADLKPALDNLEGVQQVLRDNQDSLDRTLNNAGQFYKVFANSVGSGPWFDAYIGMPQLQLGALQGSLSSELRKQLPEAKQ